MPPIHRRTRATRTRRVGWALLLWACQAAPAWAGWEAGDEAWRAGQYTQAWAELKPLAEAGDARAQNRLGVMLAEGQGVTADFGQAFHWFERAARSGLARAQYNLGLAFLSGEGVATDARRALHWVTQAAQQGDADAQVALGYLHESGTGTAANAAEAVRWYRLAAEAGDARGQTYLANMYRNGLGVPADPTTALKWLRLAAAQNHARAITLLADMADAGEGGPVDLQAALQGYRRAAEMGDAWAQASLGAFYADGRGVAQDDGLATQWYERAAAQGNGMALTNLGRMRMTGRGGPRDPAQAVALWQRAAQAEHPRGMAELGAAYIEGVGVAADAAQGVQWLRKASDAGSTIGKFRLAWAYLDGTGVGRDDHQACALFRQTAEAGLPAGMREYGARLEEGEGCPRDLAAARQWYERAAAKQDARAMYLLGVLHDNGVGLPMSKAHAVYWYVRAARLGVRGARNDLGVMYLDGEFVARDVLMAAALFQLAAKAGHEKAPENLKRAERGLDASARERLPALVEALQQPESFDMALNDSLAAAQGGPANGSAQPTSASPCLPQPTLPIQAQVNAWRKDLHDRGPLWRISKDGHTSWLYGTLHVGRASWILQGPSLTQALSEIDVLAVESDITSPSTQAAMAEAQKGMGSLDDPAIQPALDTALGSECAAAMRKQKVPQLMQSMVLGLQVAAQLQEHAAFGADLHLLVAAHRRQLPVMELESPAAGMEALKQFFKNEVREELAVGAASRLQVMQRLSRAWEAGDMQDLERYLEWCRCTQDPKDLLSLTALNDGRNPGMADRIDAAHRQGKRVLAAVGALHMTGPQGLPALMAARGYIVERVPPQRPAPEPLDEIRVTVPQTSAVRPATAR